MGLIKKLSDKILTGYQPENIIAEKQALGYDTGTDNVCISVKRESFLKSFLMEMIGRKYHVNPIYLISFEDEGILLIGINSLTGKYNGNNHFIQPEEFDDLTLKRGSLNYIFKLKSSQGKFILQISHHDHKYDYQQKTVANLENLVHSYE